MTGRISVVVASGAGGEFLFRCLDSLREQAEAEQTDVVVVDRCGGATLERLRGEYGFTKVLAAPVHPKPSVPELRALGVQAATGDVVAILEEHCVAPPCWLATIRSSFRESDVAIGGPILDDGYPHLRDWAVYFSEYSGYLPPWTEGRSRELNGANVAYERRALRRHADSLTRGYWEVVLHPSLAGEGDMRPVHGMGVRHAGAFGYGYYLGQRYLLSRVWGGTQKARVGPRLRAAYLLAGPVLPLLLLGRMALRVVRSTAPKARFVAALPLLIPIVLVYAWGEWLGYLLGPGDALRDVE